MQAELIQIRQLLLAAKENRYQLRQQYSGGKYPNISLSLNIPGYPKTDKDSKKAFNSILDELKIFLKANRIFIDEKNEYTKTDAAGDFYLTKIVDNKLELAKIKQLTEQFEENHTIGRIVDVDIFDKNAYPVSSGKAKKCIICKDKPAIQCMRSQTHGFEELRTQYFKYINDYLEQKKEAEIITFLSEIATKALLHEVSLSPKPGLVDFVSNGAHKDMNFYTFIASTAALSIFWQEFAKKGYHFDFNDPKRNALAEIRKIGLKAEHNMYCATDDVNTQKGIIFLMGSSVFVSSYVLHHFKENINQNFRKYIKIVAKGIIENELCSANDGQTHGEKVFSQYGIKAAGARFQMEKGFPMVFETSLPYLLNQQEKLIALERTHFDHILKNALVQIIANTDDTNVLYRKGENFAQEMKKNALKVFNGTKTYQEFCHFCTLENVSPGGAADLLAVSLYFFFLNKKID